MKLDISLESFLLTVRTHMTKGELKKTEEELIGSKGMWNSPRISYFVTDKLDLDTDGVNPDGVVRESTAQSQTSYRYSAGGSLNAFQTPYVVAPGKGWRKKHNIDLGDFCIVEHKGIFIATVFGDVGPATKIGEASAFVHELLGYDRVVNNRVVNIGLSGRTRFLVFKDSGYKYCPENEVIKGKCALLYKGLG